MKSISCDRLGVGLLQNPEAEWPSGVAPLNAAEICRRVPDNDRIERLAGGRANDCVRVNADRVLKIYRRDVSAMGIESSLLKRPWKNFQVPQILREGDDFLLMSFVPNEPLRDARPVGAQVGAALAEIHNRTYPSAGFFRGDLQLVPSRDFHKDLCLYLQALDTSRNTEIPHYKRLVVELCHRNRSLVQALCERSCLLHGDFKIANLRSNGDERVVIFDWEYAFVGPPLFDIGQLFRWEPSPDFERGFVAGYGSQLPENWRHKARLLDTFNLVSLLSAMPGPAQPVTQLVIHLRRALELLAQQAS